MAALSVLRDKVLKPLLAGVSRSERGPQPSEIRSLDARYEAVRQDMNLLLAELGLAA
jgi:hypothetical protein